MSRPEDIVIAEIRRALGAHARHARLFRNPHGLFWAGKVLHRDGTTVTLVHARQIEAGLVDGACDLVGWTTVIVTPDMVGKPIAVFTGAEVKKKAKATEDQINFINQIVAAGGRAGVARSPADALELVRVT